MKSFANHSGMKPEPFTTSRARADQGAGNKGAGMGSDVVRIHRHSVKANAPTMDGRSAANGGGR